MTIDLEANANANHHHPEPDPMPSEARKVSSEVSSELFASMICDEAGMLLARIRRLEPEEAIKHAESVIRHIAALCDELELDLQELLPTRACSRCTRQTVETRTFHVDGRTELVCPICVDAEMTSRSSAIHRAELSRSACLDRAKELVLGDRQGAYGPPSAAFRSIAELWSATLKAEVKPHEVALCLIQLKIARLISNPQHADSWVDAAGYAACGAEVAR